MAISADTGGGGTPFAKLLNLDDELEGALASKPRECVREQREFGKDEVKLRNGKPVKEEILWLVAMPGTTAVTGKDDDHSPIEPLDVVRFAVSGYRWGQVIDARKALPAANGFKAGESASGDVYRIRLVGWSAETENPAAAEKAGFTVVDGRIVLRSQEDKDNYVLAQSRRGGNTNPAKDVEITIRRPCPADKAYEQRADEVFLDAPWKKVAVGVGGVSAANDPADDEPFLDVVQGYRSFRNMAVSEPWL